MGGREAEVSTYNLEAVVIRSRPLVEADSLITLFSREIGKIRAAARGARKPRSRLAGGVQPFIHGRYHLWKSRSLDGIRQVEVLTSFSALRGDLDLMCHAGHMCSLTDAFTTDGDPSEPFFLLLLTSFSLLENLSPDLARRFFEVRALGVFGFRPEVESCAACGGPAGEGQHRFVAAAGGILCSRCRGQAGSGQPISRQARDLLSLLQRIHPRRLARLDWPAPGSEEMGRLLDGYLSHVLDRPLRTGLLHSLSGEGPKAPGGI